MKKVTDKYIGYGYLLLLFIIVVLIIRSTILSRNYADLEYDFKEYQIEYNEETYNIGYDNGYSAGYEDGFTEAECMYDEGE